MGRCRGSALELKLDGIDDGGMYVWAGILAAFGLGASFLIAIWWQNRRTRRQD